MVVGVSRVASWRSLTRCRRSGGRGSRSGSERHTVIQAPASSSSIPPPSPSPASASASSSRNGEEYEYSHKPSSLPYLCDRKNLSPLLVIFFGCFRFQILPGILNKKLLLLKLFRSKKRPSRRVWLRWKTSRWQSKKVSVILVFFRINSISSSTFFFFFFC